MSERTRLLDRRSCELTDFESIGMGFTVGVGRYPDETTSELFLDSHKAGSSIDTLVHDLAITFSFAVQHGADVEAICRAVRRDSAGRPLGRSAKH
jgi:hypothetical protein